MAVKVRFQNPKTGESKTVKVGWSWTLFFFANFFGLPLFLRKLPTIGAVCLAATVLNFVLPEMARDEDSRNALKLMTFLMVCGLNIWLAIKGNELTAKSLLDQGWQMLHPQSPEVAIARQTWELASPETAPLQAQS